MHPLRLQYQLLSDANPFRAPVRVLAEQVREDRRPAGDDNPFLEMQANISRQIVEGLESFRKASEAVCEKTFLAVYGNPALQSAMGVDPESDRPLRRVAKDPLHRQLQDARAAELNARIGEGGLREAMVRGLLYAGLERASVDERGFEAVRRIREAHSNTSLIAFKKMVRDQFYMLLIDEDAALAAIPGMLPADPETCAKAVAFIEQALQAFGGLSGVEIQRLARVRSLFAAPGGSSLPRQAS